MAGFLSWVQFILKLWSCLLPGQKLILSGNVLVHFLFLLSTGKNGINTKLFKSSEFGYCLFLVFFFFHIMVSTIPCSTQFRQVYNLQPWMSVPKPAGFKEICLVFDQAYSHSCAGPCEKDLNINIISGKTNPLN